jgi:hypothetical protein
MPKIPEGHVKSFVDSSAEDYRRYSGSGELTLRQEVVRQVDQFIRDRDPGNYTMWWDYFSSARA